MALTPAELLSELNFEPAAAASKSSSAGLIQRVSFHPEWIRDSL